MHQHTGHFDYRDAIDHCERRLAIALTLVGDAIGQDSRPGGQRRMGHVFRCNLDTGEAQLPPGDARPQS